MKKFNLEPYKIFNATLSHFRAQHHLWSCLLINLIYGHTLYLVLISKKPHFLLVKLNHSKLKFSLDHWLSCTKQTKKTRYKLSSSSSSSSPCQSTAQLLAALALATTNHFRRVAGHCAINRQPLAPPLVSPLAVVASPLLKPTYTSLAFKHKIDKTPTLSYSIMSFYNCFSYDIV